MATGKQIPRCHSEPLPRSVMLGQTRRGYPHGPFRGNVSQETERDKNTKRTAQADMSKMWFSNRQELDVIAVPKPPKRIKSNAIYREVEARDGYRCLLCAKPTSQLHCHHIHYKSGGGSDTLGNLISLCWSCHTFAHDHNPSLIRPLLKEILTRRYGYQYEEGEIK